MNKKSENNKSENNKSETKKLVTKEQVLKFLKIKDIKELNKKHVVALSSIIDTVEPEVAKEILEVFPDFANNVSQILKDYLEVTDNVSARATDTVKSIYDIMHMEIENLLELVNNGSLSFEQQKEILHDIKEINEQLIRLQQEYQNNSLKKHAIDTIAMAGCVLLMASVLGVKVISKFV